MTKHMTEAVAAGSALLDQHIPDWYTVIDMATLDLNSSEDCILGQLSVHPELMNPKMQRKMRTYAGAHYSRSRESERDFCRTLSALESQLSIAQVVKLHNYGFVEASMYDEKGRPTLMGVNWRAWGEAIAERKALALSRSGALDDTPIAKQVRAGIDAELAKMYRERPTHVLAA